MRAPFSVSCSNAPVPLLRSHLLTGWHNSLLTRRPRCLLLLFSHLLCTVSSPQAGPSFLYTYLLLRRSMPGLPQSKGSPELNAVRVSKTPECSFDCHLDISVWNSTVWRIILLWIYHASWKTRPVHETITWPPTEWAMDSILSPSGSHHSHGV